MSPEIVVYRAVPPFYVKWTSEDGHSVPLLRSQAFQTVSPTWAAEHDYLAPAMSVALSHLLEREGQPPDRVLDGKPAGSGIASFTVGDLQALRPRLGVVEDPTDSEPWHGLVFPIERRVIRAKEQAGLLEIASIYRDPDPL